MVQGAGCGAGSGKATFMDQSSSLGDSPSATPHRKRSGTQWQRWYARCAGLALLRCIMTLTREDGRAPSHQCVTVPDCCTDALIGLGVCATQTRPQRTGSMQTVENAVGQPRQSTRSDVYAAPSPALLRKDDGPRELTRASWQDKEVLAPKRSESSADPGREAEQVERPDENASHATLPRLCRRRWQSAQICVAGKPSELGSWHGFGARQKQAEQGEQGEQGEQDESVGGVATICVRARKNATRPDGARQARRH